MSTQTMAAKLKEYRSMKQLANEIADVIDALESEIKTAMGDVEEMTVDGIRVKWARYTTKRFDAKRFEAEHTNMYEQYTKTTSARRFQVMV